jgi:peptidyl-prolyl cis-trans isomerase A (cyclophilin A)
MAMAQASGASEPLAASASAPAKPGPKVKLVTTAGDIVIELDPNAAPKTVANFTAYVKSGFYNGTIFHRVISNFMVQTGGYTSNLAPKPTRPAIPLESRNGLYNVRGTVAMARQAAPDTATSQFFINVQDNPFLDAEMARDGKGYAVFGKVVSGMEVVDAIRMTPTHKQSVFDDLPVNPILIKRATLEK